jgi:rubrerythrin
MTISFSGSELISVAIGIEGRGIAFYDSMADATKNANTREVFRYLANMEREHLRTFQGMLAGADKLQFAETAGEYTAYLQALVDSAVFSDELIASQLAREAKSDTSALDLGIGAEKDSILFYYEMRDIMPQRAQATISKIIAEEKSHLRQLSELKKRLASL